MREANQQKFVSKIKRRRRESYTETRLKKRKDAFEDCILSSYIEPTAVWSVQISSSLPNLPTIHGNALVAQTTNIYWSSSRVAASRKHLTCMNYKQMTHPFKVLLRSSGGHLLCREQSEALGSNEIHGAVAGSCEPIIVSYMA
jgi:hypothetical protein